MTLLSFQQRRLICNEKTWKYQNKRKVADGLHEIGQISVDTGQIAISDPCNSDNPDITVDTNFGDGMFPVYEQWEIIKNWIVYSFIH